MTDANPYASPAEVDEPLPASAPGSADAMRREHLRHESAVRASGWLFLFPATLLLFLSLGSLVGVMEESVTQPATSGSIYAVAVVQVLLFGVHGVLFLWIGLGLRRLTPRVRAWAIGFSAIGLLRFPLGTIANGYLVSLLAGIKSDDIFSREYQSVVAATPYLHPKAPPIVWWSLALLVADSVGIVLALLWTIPI